MVGCAQELPIRLSEDEDVTRYEALVEGVEEVVF
jgi:hypothetical protein